MVLILIAIFMAIIGLIWLWKGPLSTSAESLQKGGSSKAESYSLISFLIILLLIAAYMIFDVID